MKILITGAGGRVGRALRRELARDHQLRLLDICPIENPEALIGFRARYGFEVRKIYRDGQLVEEGG